MMPEVSEPVAQWLQQSRAANLARLRSANATPPNYAESEAHAANALSLREAAHTADPDHTDPEWRNDTVPHAEMCAFLAGYSEIP